MYHITKDWTRMLISQMENNHLENTIKLLIKNIKNAYEVLNNWSPFKWVEAISMNIDSDNIKYRAKEYIKNNMEKLPYYIFEAQIRWMDFSELLQDLVWRKNKMDITEITGALWYEDDEYIEIPF